MEKRGEESYITLSQTRNQGKEDKRRGDGKFKGEKKSVEHGHEIERLLENLENKTKSQANMR